MDSIVSAYGKCHRKVLIIARNKQHVATILALGGLYPAPDIVGAILAPQEGERKRILDLGKVKGE